MVFGTRLVRFIREIGKLFKILFTTFILATVFVVRDATAEFSIVSKRDEFVKVITGKQLERPFIKLRVSDAGEITGRALMAGVHGTWTWKQGYFCRNLFWGKRGLGYNCQEVSLRGDKIRFTSDEGKGDYADFTLK